MHLNVAIKNCHYFRRKKPCPYEKLGCKFRHLENKQNTNEHHVEHVTNSNELDKTSRNITEEDTIEDGYTVGHIVENFDKVKELEEFDISPEEISRQNFESFHASTPKKKLSM